MAIYLVSFKLATPDADPSPLVNAIKVMGDGAWMHYIPNTVFIRSNETAKQIAARVNSLLGKNDFVLVIEVTGNYYGWLPDNAWTWFRDVLK